METITFYSYKGGVGRTLALANVAIYLSRFGQKVCALDFDLEAPGLHYKLLNEGKIGEIKKGLVDYIYEFVKNGVIKDSLEDYSLDIVPHTETQSGIRLIPAGVVLSSDYWRNLAAIDWHQLFYKKESAGLPFFLELKEKIREEFNPDYLLIDSRTGITEMSGLCTSLLADKVVFLIVHNRENIEGARQILRSLKKTNRLPEQKPIEVVFALTRIPIPEDEADKTKEEEILKQTKNYLNEPTEFLETMLNIQDICILHSDRDLELKESLRIGQEGFIKETPLLRDYLKLFSKIIPNIITDPKLDSVLKEVLLSNNIFECPDKVQKQLEDLAATYPHQKTFEKLIEFYILRREGRSKILNAFHEFEKTFGIENPQLLLKYLEIFEQLDKMEEPRFDLSIIEKYLKLDKGTNNLNIKVKLADTYVEYGRLDLALKHYKEILDLVAPNEKGVFIAKIINVLIAQESYDEAKALISSYSPIVGQSLELKLKELEINLKMNDREGMEEVFSNENFERFCIEENLDLYSSVLSALGKKLLLFTKLNNLLNDAMKRQELDRIYDIGAVYYKYDKFDDFKEQIKGRLPKEDEQKMINALMRYRGRFYPYTFRQKRLK